MKSKVLLLVFLFFSLYGQSQLHPLGAIITEKAEYDKLPRPNWDTLRKYANPATISQSPNARASGVRMLINPPIGDQGSQGSCVGWAAGYTAAGILMYPRYNCWDFALRSPAYLYNIVKAVGDCNAGAVTLDGCNWVVNWGICGWSFLPYNESSCTQPITQDMVTNASLHKGKQVVALNSNDVTGIKQALDLGYPVVIAFDVYTTFDNMWNTGGGIWNMPNSGTKRGSHAACIIGYDDSRQQFKVQNQWGTYGGDNGYFWLAYNSVQNQNLLSNVYIMYGPSQVSPMAITGDNLICSTSNNYSVSGLPSNSTVTWTSSNPALAVVNSPNATQTTVTHQGTASGIVTLTAVVSVCGGPAITIPSGTITVGLPSTPTVGATASVGNCYYDIKGTAPEYSTVTFSTNSGTTWQNPISVTWNATYNYYEFIAEPAVEGPVSYPIMVRATNACGSNTISRTVSVPKPQGGNCQVRVAVDNGAIGVSPNPANSSVVVTIKDRVGGFVSTPQLQTGGAQLLKRINIFDMQGHLVKSYSAGISSANAVINISNLISGTYLIEVFHDKGVERKKILVVH